MKNGENSRRAGLLRLCLVVGTLLLAPVVAARQMDTSTFNLLRRGMSEGEVLVRAGPPDFDSSVGERESRRGIVTEAEGEVFTAERRVVSFIKEFHYIPEAGEHDPYLTVVTFVGGRVTGLERTKVFSRARYEQPYEGPRVSDEQRKVERADRTLQSAEDYARIRAEYMDEAQAADAAAAEQALSGDAGITVYRVEQPDGTVYYGDRPPE